MITWTEFEQHQPFLAGAGRKQIYQFGIGLAFVATVRPDGGPRVHPVCPVISVAGLHLSSRRDRSRRTCAGTGVTRYTARRAPRRVTTTASRSPAAPGR
jgi:hypothetical protein